MRRRLGFKLTTFGEKLMSFISYLEHTGNTVLTTRAALAWATSTPRSSDEVHWSRRLMVVRIFARHLKALEPATEIPPDDALPHHYRRITPHLFTPAELARLLAATSALSPAFRARTWHTFIGLLAVSGLRTSGSLRSGPHRRRPCWRSSHREGDQVRQVEAGSGTCQHHHGTAEVCPGARSPAARPEHGGLPGLHPRHPTRLPQPPAHLRPAAVRGGYHRK